MAAIGVIREISERKRVERDLREYAHQLEDATALKDLFADILRHDLLGPASTVQLSLEALLKREPDAATARRMLETARRSCTKLIEIIEGAAEYAKLSTAQGIEFGPVDLAAVLREVVAEFDPRRVERGTRITLDAPGPPIVRANPMIADVFENLLSNAAKYGPQGGVVRIEVQDEGARWKVSITDSGEGIADADKEKVFMRFERLRKEGVKGIGLGLAISRRIVELHGGRIWVEDAPGGGAAVLRRARQARLRIRPRSPRRKRAERLAHAHREVRRGALSRAERRAPAQEPRVRLGDVVEEGERGRRRAPARRDARVPPGDHLRVERRLPLLAQERGPEGEPLDVVRRPRARLADDSLAHADAALAAGRREPPARAWPERVRLAANARAIVA